MPGILRTIRAKKKYCPPAVPYYQARAFLNALNDGDSRGYMLAAIGSTFLSNESATELELAKFFRNLADTLEAHAKEQK